MDNNSTMQAVKFYGNSKQLMVSAIRDTSCSRGWLRLVVQGIFGTIIVCSFILIVLMAISTTYKNQSRFQQRCMVVGCRVICNDAPFFGEFEDEILYTLADAEYNCGRVFLTLNRPMFINSTLPGHWLSGIRTNVNELEIVGGNLQQIPSDSFTTQFGGNLRVLILAKVAIKKMAADTFLGLTDLQELYIKDSTLLNIRQNALQAVDKTLNILNIKAENNWDPVYITGSTNFEKLSIVDFSKNMFHDILGPNSFAKLKRCKALYLNWCNIIAIGAGAFDNLESIEILHLNNNYLISLPLNMFKKIIPFKPRIALHDNLWHCNCHNHNLRILSKLGLLIVDPTCHYPPPRRGLSFSEFENYCEDYPITELIDSDLYIFSGKTNSTINETCDTNSTVKTTILYSPFPDNKCILNVIQRSDLATNISVLSNDNDWLRPSFSVEANGFSMISLIFHDPYDYGLIWYKSVCPNEIYCISLLPKVLRVFNEDSNIKYTFCRISVSSRSLEGNQCVAYDLERLQPTRLFYKSVLVFVFVAIICLFSGALFVYALIHRNPILLKGNKRVVFVKHKTVDALILPPKIPLRCNLPDDSNIVGENSRNIFVIPGNRRNTVSGNFIRTFSVRTTQSNDPSYISPLQPTEDQLAEWRVTRNFEIKATYDSIGSNLSISSQMFNSDYSLPYYSMEGSEKIYDTLKL